ncbi:MAG: hypothetical protein MUC36_25255 [Planctomycetes bacterium]|nr:hypothetical protein [Planctomycetota bacterium]
MIAVWTLVDGCAAQAPVPVPVPQSGARVQLGFDAQGVTGCPAEPAARSAWFGARLEATLVRLRNMLDLGDESPAQSPVKPLQLFVFDDTAAAGPAARVRCGREFQGLGVLHTEFGAAVLVPWRKSRTAAAVSRLLAHVVVQLAVARELPVDAADRLGYGWFAAGLSHRLAAECGDGLATTFVVGDVVLDTLAWGGAFAPAAQSLLQRGQLPSLASLCATEARDFDLAQHVAATALVGWLLDATNAPVTGGGAMPSKPIVELLAAARRGTPAHVALAAVLGQDLATVEARWRAAIGGPAGAASAARVATPPHPPHPHAALYVYTDEPVRERHRAIVAAALQKRHAAHTSGWQDTGGKPKIALGPVNQRAAHWHGDEFIKPIGRVWPFVAVLEYAPDGAPEAFLDCLRRVRGRETDDGWMLDPTVGFVAHHNAQLVTGSDDRFMYLAVPDTPTGGHVSGSEFVHRGRIRWANGATALVGMHTVFEAPQAGTTSGWRSVQLPLVDWFVTEQTPRLGAVAVGGCELATGELAVWGTGRVFRFPAVPAGLLAGRGRP